jgi:hypothetical protein
MNIETMNVNCLDRTISINGEGYLCASWPEADPNIASLSWRPAGASKCRGHVAYVRGPAHGTNDFSLLSPFVASWEDARERTLSRKALEHAEAHGAFGEQQSPPEEHEYTPHAATVPEGQSDLAERLERLEQRHEALKEIVADSNRTMKALMEPGVSDENI